MILDIGLPGRDGFSILKDLRRSGSAIPVVILTARDGVTDTVAGLEGGADDYVTKPFRFEKVLARIRVRLRDGVVPTETVLRAGGVALDLRTRRVQVGGRNVELTAREFTLLETFLQHQGQVLARATAEPRMGPRLRSGIERGRRVRRLPAQEGRRGPDQHRARHGLPLRGRRGSGLGAGFATGGQGGRTAS